MPTINFRILSTPEQLAEVEQDFRSLLGGFGDALDADLNIVTDQVPDPELETTWVEVFGESDSDNPPVGSTLTVSVRRFDRGSISGLTIHLAQALTIIEDEPAEPLLREVKDDVGTPRVPWHVEVTP